MTATFSFSMSSFEVENARTSTRFDLDSRGSLDVYFCDLAVAAVWRANRRAAGGSNPTESTKIGTIRLDSFTTLLFSEAMAG